MWRKENQSGNEMINFCEVFGLHDYRILISEKWIQLRLANVLEKWKLYMLEHAKQNCTANQGMVFLLIGQPATDKKKHFSSCRTTET